MAISTRQGLCVMLFVACVTAASPGTAFGLPQTGPDVVLDDGGTTAGRQHPGGEQHGGLDGHLPPRQKNVELISKLQLTNIPGRIADVTVYNNTAYLAAFNEPCGPGGVYVVDISDVENPVRTGFIPTTFGSFVGEGVQVVTVATPRFRGDLLIFNNEICGTSDHAVGGATLVDVTDPANPRVLSSGFGDFDTDGVPDETGVAHQVHSAFAWRDGLKAYAVLVDDQESADVDIFDISNPRRPVKIAEHDLAALFPRILQPEVPNLSEVFLHDVVVKKIATRQVMLASYWDAGYVTLDVSNPTRPLYIGDTDFTNPDPELLESTGDAQLPEGNGHQAEFTRNNEFIIGADEDFDPLALNSRNLTDDTALTAGQGSDTPSLQDGESIGGETVFAGRACDADPPVPPGDGSQIAVVERGVCTFTEKVANVEEAGGYTAVLIFNREGSDACMATSSMSVEGGLPTFGVIPRDQGYALFDEPYNNQSCLAGDGTMTAPIPLGTEGDEVVFTGYFDGWGYVHLFDTGRGAMTELDTYAIPEAHDPRFSSDFGALSVHEVATSPTRSDLAYLSYYAGGFRVLQIRDNELVEVGSFIDRGGNDFWGVQVFLSGGHEYVAASDRDSGLYILEYTGRR